ncbi:cytochrome P450 [Crucibulum laeve]|uniref:Cytochrome P450 n=1 Tax=Crucibulum laeve TaxID=68775 RepID=A0A5C3MFR9_9AGAR|nr:cytochrome P450 [Crucibulum laeve]
MIRFILQAVGLYAFSWGFWYIIRRFIRKTTLDNIPGPPPQSFTKGNLLQLHNVNGWAFHKHLSEKYGSVTKLKALFGKDQLYICDPKAMHHIIVKDQYVYEETSSFFSFNRLFFGEGLLSTMGDHHRKQRKMLNPVFSIAHMRHMTPIFWGIAKQLQGTLSNKLKNGPQEVDITHWMVRTALELIGQSGFGYSFDPLTEDGVPHPYSKAVKQLIPASFKLNLACIYLLPIASKIGTPRFQRWVVDMIPWKAVHDLRDILDVMDSTSSEILTTKQKALEEGGEALSQQVAGGKDLMSILLRANIEASEEERLAEKEILGQISTFTFAAMDTTSGALSRILHVLSTYPDAQRRLRQEILDAAADKEEIPYDTLVNLPFLDAVCRETLRLYPPVSMVMRTTREDVVLPLGVPVTGVDGREMDEILVPKDTDIIVSILNANCNPEIWGPDSYEWKPERWLSSLPESVPAARIPGVYSNLMTFLGGGRACIGFKFSQLEMKVVLAMLLRSFEFSPSEKEIFWQMSGIAIPVVVGGDPLRASLPMKMTLLDRTD